MDEATFRNAARGNETDLIDENFLPIIETYMRRLPLYSVAQYWAAHKMDDKNKVITIFLIFSSILTVLLTSASWSTSVTNHTLSISRDLFGVVTVALAAVQYALNYSEKAAQHKLAATEYSRVYREMEMLVHKLKMGNSIPMAHWKHITEQYGLITKLTPLVSEKLYNKYIGDRLNTPAESKGTAKRSRIGS